MSGSHWVERARLGIGWTAERVEKLTKLAFSGLSASQIAGVLGSTTRNAVIGRLHRMKICLPKKGNGSATRPPKPKFKPVARTVPPLATDRPGQRGGLQTVVPAATLPLTPPRKSEWSGIAGAVDALGLRECRWPMGDMREPPTGFCRAPVASRFVSYCEHHLHISRYGAPGRQSGLSYDQQRKMILAKLCDQKRIHASEVAGVMACQTDEANAAIARTRAWLLTQGITVTSAQAAGYWISPGDKHLALALLKQIEAR